tara:strand:- start:382 stop:819 length:438 start_codon:yes stop_codon:yes gene_type:complete
MQNSSARFSTIPSNTTPLVNTHTHTPIHKNGRQETSEEDRQRRRQEVLEKEGRNVQDLHLQSLEASPSGHRDFQQGDEHHELVHQRHLRKDRDGSREIGEVQQETHGDEQRNPNVREIDLAGRIGQARGVGRDQGGDEVYFRLIN